MANVMHAHYESKHSIRDPDVVTQFVRTCADCKGNFATIWDLKTHKCAAKERIRTRQEISIDSWLPVRQQAEREPPMYWHIATDGSGQVEWKENDRLGGSDIQGPDRGRRARVFSTCTSSSGRMGPSLVGGTGQNK